MKKKIKSKVQESFLQKESAGVLSMRYRKIKKQEEGGELMLRREPKTNVNARIPVKLKKQLDVYGKQHGYRVSSLAAYILEKAASDVLENLTKTEVKS